jgi:hypothetical protein
VEREKRLVSLYLCRQCKVKKFSLPKKFLQIIRIRRFLIPVTYHCAWFKFSRAAGFTVISELKIPRGAHGADGAGDNCLHVTKLGLTNGIQCRWCDSSWQGVGSREPSDYITGRIFFTSWATVSFSRRTQLPRVIYFLLPTMLLSHLQFH